MKRDYIDFQDRSTPLAYLITFRCYGTWLHGDERGSVHRKDDNRYGEPDSRENSRLENSDRSRLVHPKFVLTVPQRKVVEAAITEVCVHKGVPLYALNVRSNHAHSVISTLEKPEPIMTSFKAYATRRLREAGLVSPDAKIWARHGSTRYLWTEAQVGSAITYVKFEQGDY